MLWNETTVPVDIAGVFPAGFPAAQIAQVH